jgi:translation initiation factor RLI1
MAGKIALVDYNKCCPDQCENGVCRAVKACPFKLIKQEAPHEIPMTAPFSCKGCGLCATACYSKAIIVTRS